MRSSAGTFPVHSISRPPSVQFFAATLYLRSGVRFFLALFHRCFFREFFCKVFLVCLFCRGFLPAPFVASFLVRSFTGAFLGFIAGTSSVRSFAFHRVFSVCFITRDFCVCSLPGASSEPSSAVAFFSVHTFAWEFSMSSSAGFFSLSVNFLPGCLQCARSQGPSCSAFSPGLSPCAFLTGFQRALFCGSFFRASFCRGSFVILCAH